MMSSPFINMLVSIFTRCFKSSSLSAHLSLFQELHLSRADASLYMPSF